MARRTTTKTWTTTLTWRDGREFVGGTCAHVCTLGTQVLSGRAVAGGVVDSKGFGLGQISIGGSRIDEDDGGEE